MIFVVGASGYVGGRLVDRLQAHGKKVRCLSRSPEALRPRLTSGTEIVRGDLLDADTLLFPMQGMDTAYYLAHFLNAGQDFEKTELQAAENFAQAARISGVGRIIYLGGLGDENSELSPHLFTRQEVGRIFRASTVPTIEFRASIIIGRGSFSFEFIRNLVDRMPVMLAPDWVEQVTQPIAIDDVLRYLVGALDLEGNDNEIFEIGGADQLSYAELLQEYAAQTEKSRLMFELPVPAPFKNLSDLWIHKYAPSQASVGLRLIESMQHPTIVHTPRARQLFGFEPMGVEEAIRLALADRD
jgi:uncharacterized protein YbjT (DUF2867 family)